MRITCTATPECLKAVRDKLRARLASRLEGRALDEVCLAIGEACANVVEHAYKDLPPGPLAVELEVGATTLQLTLRDRGHPIEPESCKPRDLDDVKPGGLGLHFMQCAFDPIEYDRENGWNRVVLVRKLPPARETN